MAQNQTNAVVLSAEEFTVSAEPYYRPLGDEIELFEAAYDQRVPVLLKGPTGCGKTRFVEYMSYRLGHQGDSSKKGRSKKTNSDNSQRPLVPVAGHEELTASDLVGRYLLDTDGTHWIDGPLTRAVKSGAICYLDEVVEARKDTTVLIHPLTDHRRMLPVEKKGELLEAAEGFLLVLSYNPGYQSALKDLKHSTRQRFVSIEFNPPPREIEAEIVAHEANIDLDMAMRLAQLGEKVRNLREHGLGEGASTRLLIYAGKLIGAGIKPRRACQVAVNWSVTDDHSLQNSIEEVTASIFE